MVGLNLHIYQNHAVLSLDSSGDSLHKRGYRPILTQGAAQRGPRRGLVLLTGWRGDVPFVDPLCGSGTLCIEAAWLALRPAAGADAQALRLHGLDGLRRRPVDASCATRRGAASQKQLPAPGRWASDAAPRRGAHFASDNARAAGIGHLLRFAVRDVRDFQPPEGPPGVILCNPPYGERIGEEKDLIPLYRALGEVIERCPGWKAFVFTGNAFLAQDRSPAHSRGGIVQWQAAVSISGVCAGRMRRMMSSAVLRARNGEPNGHVCAGPGDDRVQHHADREDADHQRHDHLGRVQILGVKVLNLGVAEGNRAAWPWSWACGSDMETPCS